MNSRSIETGSGASFARRGSRILATATIAAMTIGAGLVMAPAASAAEGIGHVSGEVLYGEQPGDAGYVQFFDTLDPNAVVDYAYVTNGSYDVDLPVGEYTAQIVSISDPDSYVYETFGLEHGVYGDPAVISVTESGDAVADFAYDYTIVSDEYGTVTPDDAELGDTVTLTPSTWQTAQVENSFQWFADDEPIDGATDATLELTNDLANTYISVVQTGSRLGGYYDTELSNALGYVAGREFDQAGYADLNNTQPRVGDTLSIDITDEWLPTPTSYGYEWRVQGIEGDEAEDTLVSTDASFVVPASLLGEVIYGTIIAKRAGYTDDYRWAGETQPVAGPALTATKPVVSGTAKIGSTLKASAPVWNETGVTTSYRWYATYPGTTYAYSIPGAVKSSYKVTGTWAGYKISVKVTGKKANFSTTTVASALTKTVPYLKVTAATPKLSGTFEVGKTVKASAGSWKPSGMKFFYVWNFNGKPYAETVKGSFTLPKAAKGKKVTVTVSGYKAGYEYKYKTSKSSSKVK